MDDDRSPRREDDDRGAGTVAVLGLAAAVIGLAVLLAGIAGIPVARHRAMTGADAAALAAAAIVAGFGTDLGEEPCAAAGALLDRHGVEMRSCVVDGLDVTIEASVVTPFGPVAARSTAGPPGPR